MTTLPVTLGDQTLIAMEKVKIASGDIESVFLKVEFDENWADFTARSASFYTSHDSTPQEELLIDNQCTIPADMLAQPGTLYVGVVGATADGSAVKTSSVIGFRIVQGANHAYTTIKPNLDMYQQILAAMKTESDPITQAFKNQIWADYEAVRNDLTTLLDGEVLWTNPDDTQTFERQTIQLDLAEYKRITIRFKHHATQESNYGYSESSCNVKGVKYHHSCYEVLYSTTNGKNCARSFKFKDDGVEFINGVANGEQNDNVCIPVEIRAYKCY